MDTDKLNRWLTLAANTGVLIGIILLVVELDQNREIIRAQTRNEISQGELELLGQIAGNPPLAEMLVRANQGHALSPDEELMVFVHSESVFRLWQNVHYQGRLGMYDEEEFEKHLATMERVLGRSPYLVEYWCADEEVYPEEFAREINSLIPAGDCSD